MTDSTIIALSTPPGVGAIGVVRLSGPAAVTITDGTFPGKDLTAVASHTVHYGSLRDAENQVIDEVVVTIFRAPRSYTGEDVVEISCHGSPYILQRTLERFYELGVQPAQPGEFTQRAFLNGRMDLTQAEAVAELIASDSAKSHALALNQMRGGFSRQIGALRDRLVHFASMLELELDFGEEDVEFADRTQLLNLTTEVRQTIRRLMDSFQLGNVLRNGVDTVLAGRPNAGKSTLLNALLNEDRAIVSDIAGTTRDTIEAVVNIQGVHFRLTDTAGIREAQDEIEAIGVERTLDKVRGATLLCYVFDVIQQQPAEVHADLARLTDADTGGRAHVLVVANKMDLNPYTKWEHYAQPPLVTQENFIPVSAENGMNIEYLKERLYQAVIDENLQTENPVAANGRHVGALRRAEDALARVHDGLTNGMPSDLIALDLRDGLRHLGEITGEVSTDDLLDKIFREFCIGK